MGIGFLLLFLAQGLAWMDTKAGIFWGLSLTSLLYKTEAFVGSQKFFFQRSQCLASERTFFVGIIIQGELVKKRFEGDQQRCSGGIGWWGLIGYSLVCEIAENW